MRRGPGMFAQLALVIALVLAGAGVLAVVLGRELAIAPAADQLARAMRGFASIAEELDRSSGHAVTLRYLREAGLEVRDTAPVADARGFAPLLRALRRRAADTLGAERAVVLAEDRGGDRLWMQLRTTPALWISFTAQPPRGSRRFSMALLLGCVGLTWLAAAYVAQRLVGPLRQLAQAAPGLVRGEPSRLAVRGPREVRELADALEQASEDVRSAADERALMLAGISHDLRTPLTRVQFATALLPDTDPTLRAGIDRDIAEIDAILSQFIAYARDGRDEAAEPTDLAEVCRAALDAAGGDWDVQCPDHAPLRGRPIALRRAVENLVGNAQRHGAAPFSLQLTASADGAWQVAVCDHGPGMDAAQAQRALQPFVHDPAGGGSGLGLAIVERVARQHGGALQLLPNVPHGLRAVLRLAAA